MRNVPASQLRAGNNTLLYSHTGGFGEFIEKPGPMLVVHYRNATGTAPAIAAPPADQSVTAGQTATFSVTATGPRR